MRKKFLIKSFRIKNLFAIWFCFAVVFAFCISSSKTEFVSVPKDTITVVIDAGHGGLDVK